MTGMGVSYHQKKKEKGDVYFAILSSYKKLYLIDGIVKLIYFMQYIVFWWCVAFFFFFFGFWVKG